MSKRIMNTAGIVRAGRAARADRITRRAGACQTPAHGGGTRPADEERTPMSLFSAFGYDGKRALVVGGASGMGAAVAELVQDAGADVVVMDYADITLAGAQAIHVNLADRASIDAALAECGGPVDVVFSCAGVADGTPGIEKVNFIGHRYLIDRLLADGTLGRGGAIGFISSAAGLGWESNLAELQEYIAITDFDAASQWALDHNHADYMWSKQTICTYVAQEAMGLLERGIRINAICPGPTDTPLAQANKEMWLGFGADYRAKVGVEASTPLDQAYPLVFLCSDAAAVVTGTIMVTDSGYFSAGMTGSFPDATPTVNFLLGRFDRL
jgi:NAD(P)-dependent dehydrogenase (short-subunit alcohol dehydrogenase family)